MSASYTEVNVSGPKTDIRTLSYAIAGKADVDRAGQDVRF